MPNPQLSSTSSQAGSGNPTGRRARNRIARHDQLMKASMEIVAAEGVEGLTMMSVAERVGCAVGTIYTYFDSKSALVAALEATAIRTLMETYHVGAENWERGLDQLDVPEDIASLVRVIATGRIFVALDNLHPREFEMLQMLLTVKQDLTTNADRDAVLPVGLAFMNDIRSTIDAAAASGAIDAPSDKPYGGLNQPPDNPFDRTIRWISAINGALMTTNVGVDPDRIDPGLFDGRRLGLSLAHDMLLAWGAQKGAMNEAFKIVEELDALGLLIPAIDAPEPEPESSDIED